MKKILKAKFKNEESKENLLKLRSIVERHAAAPKYDYPILAGLTELDMVDGPKLKVAVKNGVITVDDVKVETAIYAKNGVVYIVDTVLLAK